tara:strand:+ start:8135 stop:9340 length:1206 start_codon:yes stop_codon:yes gene_type:complete
MKIPFSPPLINSDVTDEVLDSLNSGWITTGPKVKLLESQIQQLSTAPEVLCVNSWTSGAMLILKWLGVEAGDEVIIPAYTYSATALAVIHAGATPVIVDVSDDFNISIPAIKNAITKKTKAIIPVDIAGWPCDYTAINHLAEESKTIFQPNSEIQRKLGRILVISDAAHSIGAKYKNSNAGVLTDITIFSLHAVKNVTTAEGGAICINMPKPFDNKEIYNVLRCYSLNGQTKDAFSKSKAGAWRYDIIYPGLKINMPDVLAAIGVGQMKSYEKDSLPKRNTIFNKYNSLLGDKKWAITPPFSSNEKSSSCHIYALRIKDITEEQRDKIIDLISQEDVAVNVHFQPLPLLTIFKEMGFDIKNFPVAYNQYKNEISLPIYTQLTNKELEFIADVVIRAVEKII